MGNLIDLPNISLDSVSTEKPFKEKAFNSKNYLNLKLEDGETEKTVTIRLLPMNLETGNPFVKIHVHNVKVPSELASNPQKPFKDYICLAKTNDIDHEKFGNDCPFCEINSSAYKESLKTDDKVQKSEWVKISLDNHAREAVIFRCIERGKENEGVKFCKVKIREKGKDDIYNQILKLYHIRKENAEKKGKVENILDIYEGRDLNITITADPTAAPKVVDDSDRSPLSTNEELMKKWIYDEKKWQDVFTCKPYEYLKLVSEMRVPWFDKDNNIWVDRDEYNAAHGKAKTSASEDANEATKKAIAEAKAVEKAVEEKAAAEPKPAVEEPSKDEKPSFAASITIDDDLPF